MFWLILQTYTLLCESSQPKTTTENADVCVRFPTKSAETTVSSLQILTIKVFIDLTLFECIGTYFVFLRMVDFEYSQTYVPVSENR